MFTKKINKTKKNQKRNIADACSDINSFARVNSIDVMKFGGICSEDCIHIHISTHTLSHKHTHTHIYSHTPPPISMYVYI